MPTVERQFQTVLARTDDVTRAASVICGAYIPLDNTVLSNKIIRERYQQVQPNVPVEELRRCVESYSSDPTIRYRAETAIKTLNAGRLGGAIACANYLHAYAMVEVVGVNPAFNDSLSVHMKIANEMYTAFQNAHLWSVYPSGRKLMTEWNDDFDNKRVQPGYEKVREFIHRGLMTKAFPDTLHVFDPYAIGIRTPDTTRNFRS